MRGNFNNKNFQRPNLQDMTFEERKAFVLSRLDRNIERLTQRLENVDTMPVNDEIKAEMKEHLPERINKLKKAKEKVNSAKTNEDLKKIREERRKEMQKHRAKMRKKMGNLGICRMMRRMRGNHQRQGFLNHEFNIKQ